MFLDPAPPPTDEICNVFNELRSDMVLLCELRTALADCKFELESLKHQFEAVCPGKVSTLHQIAFFSPNSNMLRSRRLSDTERSFLIDQHAEHKAGDNGRDECRRAVSNSDDVSSSELVSVHRDNLN